MSYETAAGGTFGVEYDALGRITDLPAKYSGGGKLETSYYVNDLTRSQTQGEITNTYELDAAMRQRKRSRTKGEEASTEIYHYAGGTDSPSWVDEGEGQWTRFIGGIGAGAIEKSATEDVVFQLTDLHGDIVATADSDIEATELLSTQQFDEYGNPKQKLAPDLKLGWLGSKMRRTELPSGVIQMGVRSYVPAMGRFLSPDPIEGGSANDYEYASGDPVNNFDLTGEKCVGKGAWIKRCKAKKRRAVRKRRRRERRELRRANRTGILRVSMRGNAMQNLLKKPLLIERLSRKAGRWTLRDQRELRRAAANGPRVPVPKPVKCSDIAKGATYAGGAGLGLIVSPIPGGRVIGGIVTGFAGAVGTGAQLASDTGLC